MTPSRPALLIALTLWLLAPVAEAAADESPSGSNRVLLAASGGGTYVSRSAPGFVGQVTGGGGGLQVTAYPRRPLIDDGSPYSLWPYLQRADRLTLDGRFSVTNREDRYQGSLEATGCKAGGAALSLEVYLLRWLALSADAGAVLTQLEGGASAWRNVMSLSGSVGLGLRAGTFRFDAGYGQAGTWLDQQPVPLEWGRVFGRLRWVVKRATDIYVFGSTAPQGGSLQAGIEWFLLRNLGVFAQAGVGYAKFYLSEGDPMHYLHLFGRAGASFWFTRRFGLSASYQLFRSAQEEARFEALGHDVTLTVFGRP